jgi:hypothetical protein
LNVACNNFGFSFTGGGIFFFLLTGVEAGELRGGLVQSVWLAAEDRLMLVVVCVVGVDMDPLLMVGVAESPPLLLLCCWPMLPLSLLFMRGEMARLLCSEKLRSEVSLTGLGFLTLS